MNRILTVLVLGLLLIVSVSANKAMASWVLFSTQDLIQRSDVILIGYIVGPIGEEKSKSELSIWRTYWKVRVDYYLKGNQESEEIIVVTPGAENKSVRTSIDYKLDAWGKKVLLFLEEWDGAFVPISPQGVVTLQKNKYTPKPEEQLTGKRVLREYTILNEDLENFITQNSSIVVPKPGAVTEYKMPRTLNYATVIYVASIILALIVTGGWLLKRGLNRR